MDIVRELHEVLSKTSVLFFAALGIWGLFRAFRGREVNSSYLAALVIGEAVFVLQGILGLVLIIAGGRPDRMIHLLYGAVALLALPALFAYMKGDDSNQAQWYYGILTILLVGIAFRAIGTSV
jgi:heme A synthase